MAEHYFAALMRFIHRCRGHINRHGQHRVLTNPCAGGWIGNFKVLDNAVKWMSPPDATLFKNFEKEIADSFIDQVLAEVSAAQ